nr:TonB-dependent receptor [uncultured Porphyromonas sp.]
MRITTNLICIVAAASSLAAQTSKSPIKGTLLGGSTQRPVDFASLLLRSPKDSTLVTGTQSKADGSFRFEAPQGRYILEVRALGYKTWYRQLTLTSATDLGKILLSEDTKQLGEVQIAAKRPIMQRKADRMVFDPEQLAPAGTTALDLLRETPGVNVTDEGISLIGKGSVVVLINDKRVRLSGSALANLLRSYSKADLSEVQILTTPPAKYEAEGNAGVLNIVLKKAKNDFFGGNINTSLKYRDEHWGYSASTGLNYKKGRISSSLQLNAGQYTNIGGFATYRSYTQRPLYSSSESKFNITGQWAGLRASLDYQLSPELSLGASLSFSPSIEKPRRENLTEDYTTLPSGQRQLQLRMPGTADERERSSYTSANVHLEKSFAGHKGRRLSWDVDYVGFDSREERNFDSKSYSSTGALLPGQDFRFDSETHQQTRSYISSMDYSHPLGALQLNFGVKGSWTRTSNVNDYAASSTLGERHDQLRFDEHIYALYADLARSLSAQWSLRSGLRLEYTHTDGQVNGQHRLKTRDYLNLFPTVFVGYTPSERHAFSLNGSIRLQRPHFGQLSPFPKYENRYSTLQGKEDLRAAQQANLSLGYTLGGKLNLQLSGSYLWDGIAQVVRLDPATNQGYYTHDNAAEDRRLTLDMSYIFNSWSFLQSYISQQVSYTDSRVLYEGRKLYGSTGLSYNFNINNTLFLNRSKTLQGTVSLYYTSPMYDAGLRIGHILNGGIGLSYSLLEGKLRLTTGLSNLFAKDVAMRLSNADYEMRVVNSSTVNNFKIGLSYHFGARIKSKEARGSADELRSRM